MQLKILTEAGNAIGYGHLSRCSSLYDAAVDRKIPVELVVYGDVENVNFLASRLVKSIDWMNESYIEDNIKDTDYIIIDSYLASEGIYSQIARKAKKVLYIDDTNRIKYPPGIIINPALGIGDLKYDLSAGQELYYGADYVILRDAFHNVKRTRYKGRIEKVLITMGGTDTANVTPRIIDSLCSVYSEINFLVVVSQDKLEDYQYEYKNSKNIIFYTNLSAEEMRDVMLDCDLAISAAGQTIYELLATETPFIAIQTAENQASHLSVFTEKYQINNIISIFRTGWEKTLQVLFIKCIGKPQRTNLNIHFLGAENIIDIFILKSR